MKHAILIFTAMLLSIAHLEAQEHEVHEDTLSTTETTSHTFEAPLSALRNINGDMLYSDNNGEWLTRDVWQQRYGRREFRRHFGDGTRYDHSQEMNFLRSNIMQSVILQGEGNVIWERVVETDTPREELMLAARKRMADVIYESETKIVGGVIEHGFIRDELGRPWGIKHAHWKGIVSYEFRDGRYKVTVSHIQYKASRGSSLGLYSLGFSTEKAYAPIANLLYPYSHRASDQRYYRLVDFIDYNFTSTFVLFDATLESNDW